MPNKAKHAFGSLSGVENALANNKINAYDILFLDGDTDPKVGWIDKNGVFRLVESKNQVVRVNELPVADGDENVIYVYNNEAYIWDGTKCVSTCKPTDVSALEAELDKKANAEEVNAKFETKADASDVTALEDAVSKKVDAATVQTMIEEHYNAAIEILEF